MVQRKLLLSNLGLSNTWEHFLVDESLTNSQQKKMKGKNMEILVKTSLSHEEYLKKNT